MTRNHIWSWLILLSLCDNQSKVFPFRKFEQVKEPLVAEFDGVCVGYLRHTFMRLRSLGELTDGQFRDGAVAQVLAMEFWTRGEAPTLAEFARAWTQAKADEHRLLTAEYSVLTKVF